MQNLFSETLAHSLRVGKEITFDTGIMASLCTTVGVLFTILDSSLLSNMVKLDPAIIGAYLPFSSKHMDLTQAGLVAEVAYRSARYLLTIIQPQST